MQEITILGAGDSGLALIESVRAKNIPCKITLIDKNNYFFSKKRLVNNPADMSKRLELDKWADEKEVEFISAYVTKVNPRRRKIYFKDGEAKDFNNLVVAAGLKSKELTIKGEHRDGFFYFSEIEPFKLKNFLKISKEVCIYVSTWLGIRVAIALADLGKDVKVVSSNLDFLGEAKEQIVNTLREKSIVLYLNASIEEAVGEGMIKAVKLSPLMIFSSQLVFVDSGFVPNLKFFDEEIRVENVFCTNFERVYFLGDLIRSNIEIETFANFDYEGTKEQTKMFADFVAAGMKLNFSNQDVEVH